MRNPISIDTHIKDNCVQNHFPLPGMVRDLWFNSGIRGSCTPSAKVQAASAVSAVDTHRSRWHSGCTG